MIIIVHHLLLLNNFSAVITPPGSVKQVAGLMVVVLAIRDAAIIIINYYYYDNSKKAYGNCIREPVVRAASQRAMDGENDGLIADFATRGVWERSRDCIFNTRMYMLVVLVVLLAASLTAVSSIARRD